MKQILFLITLHIFVLGCKNDKVEPLPEIKTIVGKWRHEADEKTVNGQKTWEKVNSNEPHYLVFRFDGVILNSKGLRACCTPSAYNLNGVAFTIIPKTAIPENNQCNLVDCISCTSWDILQNEDQLILSGCGNVSRAKYVRHRN